MFYLLILIGLLSVGIGVALLKNSNKNINDKEDLSYKEIEEMHLLNKRIEDLERVFLLEEDLGKKDEMELIEKYEEEGYSIEEIARLLNKSKGEVLLLKKLKKSYQE